MDIVKKYGRVGLLAGVGVCLLVYVVYSAISYISGYELNPAIMAWFKSSIQALKIWQLILILYLMKWT
jgi:hypothetical protein